MPLSKRELDYHKGWISESEQEHKIKMMDINMPESVIDMYESRIGNSDDRSDYLDALENHLAISVDTVIPTLFYQSPRPLVRAKSSQYKYSASVINSLAAFYMDDYWKNENQLCILDAFLGYGYGVLKLGYNSRTGVANVNPDILTGKVKTKNESNIEEGKTEYTMYEKMVYARMSPKDSWLDHTKPFDKGQRITFKLKRTLQELIDSNLYPLESNFINYFGGKTDDKRKKTFDVFEHFLLVNGYCWKLVYVNEYPTELYFGKTPYKELPVALLRFKKAPDRLYSTSHGRLAYSAQKELNYLNELWKQHLDHTRNQHMVWEDALTESGKVTLKTNEIGGIVTTTKPITAGVYANIASNPMSKDVYANIDNVRGYLKLLLSISGGRSGEADAKFATTENAQAQGDNMRMGGLQDAIRDFVKKQIRMTVADIVNLGSPELTIKITDQDVIDPQTGEPITGRELQIGGDGGLVLQNEIKGDIEKDYIYDCDITSAARPDFAVIRKQLQDGITMSIALRPLLQEKGKDLDISEMVKDYFNTYDTIPNPDKYIIDMSPQDKAMLQMKQQMMAGGQPGAMPGASPNVPTEQGIAQGANAVPTGVPNGLQI